MISDSLGILAGLHTVGRLAPGTSAAEPCEKTWRTEGPQRSARGQGAPGASLNQGKPVLARSCRCWGNADLARPNNGPGPENVREQKQTKALPDNEKITL